MPSDAERHHRQSVRIPHHAYRDGIYFVTICTFDRVRWLGEVTDGEIRLSRAGWIVEQEWVRAEQIRAGVMIDVFCVMPDHLHGIVRLRGHEIEADSAEAYGEVGADGPTAHSGDGADGPGAHSGVPLRRARSLSSLVAQFKATSTRAINEALGMQSTKIWQRGFYEHVVRDDDDFERIADYIVRNPDRWITAPES